MADIAKLKEKINHMIGQVGILINLDQTSELALSSTKLDFDAPPAGWLFYGLTSQETAITTDVQVFDSKVGVPEFIIKRFLVGVEGTITGTFLEADLTIHDMITGNGTIKNIGPSGAAITFTGQDATAKTITLPTASAGSLFVNNTVVCAADADLETSLNTARITSITIAGSDSVLHFDESWFPTTPAFGSMKLQQYTYGIAQLGASTLDELQVMLVFETSEGVQFLYHFPKCTFTPNISPTFSNTGEVYKMPFELKVYGVENDYASLFDGETKVLGFYYELYKRFLS